MAKLFPAFLKLEGRNCLVVGAGTIAEQKLGGLLHAGAHIHVIAPKAGDMIRSLAEAGQLCWRKREFRATDLDGIRLVIAATGDPAVNERIYRAAEERGILCNAVDEPERCHFYYPAVVQRGDLQLAISTAGHSPALAQRIRRQLEEQFDSVYGDWLRWLGQARRALFKRQMDPQRRRKLLHRIASAGSYQRFSRAQAKTGVSQ